MEEYTPTMVQNAHKVAFLVQQYPDNSLDKLISALQMPAIDINTAIWLATELGFIKNPEETDGKMVLLSVPEAWDFGQAVTDIKAMLKFSFVELAKREKDLEENYLSNWTLGHQGHDVLIALKQMLNEKVLATYELTDPEDTKSTYTFYSLYENSEQLWGRKNFKTQPTGEEIPDTNEE